MINESQILLDIDGAKDYMKKCVDEYFHAKETERKNYQKVEIKTCKEMPIFTELYINGQKIEGVRHLELTHNAGDIPRLHIDINAMNLAIDEMCVCTAEGWGDFAIRTIDPHLEEMEKEGE